MPREICQEAKLKQEKIDSLCESCSSKDGCADAYALKLIALGDGPREGKTHIVIECGAYLPMTGAFSRGGIEAKMAAFMAGVRDLCEGCPDGERTGCAHRRKLHGLTQVGIERGEWIKPIVVNCTTLKEPSSEKLYQISEPRR